MDKTTFYYILKANYTDKQFNKLPLYTYLSFITQKNTYNS